MRFNLKQTSLLDASGELSPRAHKKLLEQVQNDPAANADYQTAHQNFAVFGALPIPEPSAAQRQYIPRMIKQAIHSALGQHEKQAGRSRLLIRCAAGAVALAACVTILATLMHASRTQAASQREQVAGIQSMIDRVTLPADPVALADDQAVTESPIGEPQTESPTLSYLHDRDMGNLFNALAAVPDERGEPMASDPSAPPGSF